MNQTIDITQSYEDAAEATMDRMTEGLPAGKFRCDCGRVSELENAVSASPNPWSPPICPHCAEESMNQTQIVKRYNGWELAEQSDGPLVNYSDYEALTHQRSAVVRALQEMVDAFEPGYPKPLEAFEQVAINNARTALKSAGEM